MHPTTYMYGQIGYLAVFSMAYAKLLLEQDCVLFEGFWLF